MWDFEFAITFSPFARTFYDTDNDGEIDLSLSDVKGERVAELAISKKDGNWQRIDMPGQLTIDPKLFKDEAMSKRLMQMLK
jgi:hypothetical protein